jgi:soluble lytic murein transglycosylase-like protein
VAQLRAFRNGARLALGTTKRSDVKSRAGTAADNSGFTGLAASRQLNACWQTPPHIKLSQLKTITLETALAMPNSVYETCKPYVGLFEKHAAANGMPPILLAAIAMQESE